MTPRDDGVRAPGAAAAVAAGDSVLAERDGERGAFRRDEQRAFDDFVGPDRDCVVDDAAALVEAMAGVAPKVADPLWTILDPCRLLDVRLVKRAAFRLESHCPGTHHPAKGTADARLAELRGLVDGEFREPAVVLAGRGDNGFGPLRAGYEPRDQPASRLAAILEVHRDARPRGQFAACIAGRTAPLTIDESNDHFRRPLRGTRWERPVGGGRKRVVVRWHVYRHSFASNLAAAGVDQRIVDGWMGHKTEEMRKRYRHLRPAVRRSAVVRLDYRAAAPNTGAADELAR